MVQAAVFQLAIGLGGFFFVLWFADMLEYEDDNALENKVLGALLLYSTSLFTLLVPATMDTMRFLGYAIPPLQVWFEAATMGFLVSAVWDIFYTQ